MADPKPFASLSSGLLARKGAARPAMRPQGFGQVGGGIEEDLGWNDMGFEAPKPTAVPRDEGHDAVGEDLDDGRPRVHRTGLTPVQSPVHGQQADLADRLGIDEEDEEFDETAELYDPNAVDAGERQDDDAEIEETEAEEAEAQETVANELCDVRREKVQALPVREMVEDEPSELAERIEDSETVELTERVEETAPETRDEPAPFELTDRFEDFDPFEPAEEVEAFVPPPPPPPPAPVFEASPVYEIVPTRQPTYRAMPGTKAKAAFTLRLDPDRHLKLRLACAVNGRSAQQIVTDAVDQLLREMPELDAMAEKAKRKG